MATTATTRVKESSGGMKSCTGIKFCGAPMMCQVVACSSATGRVGKAISWFC